MPPIKNRHTDRGHQSILLKIVLLVVRSFVFLYESSVLFFPGIQKVALFVSVIDTVELNDFSLQAPFLLVPKPVGHFWVSNIGVNRCPYNRMIGTSENEWPCHNWHIVEDLNQVNVKK